MVRNVTAADLRRETCCKWRTHDNNNLVQFQITQHGHDPEAWARGGHWPERAPAGGEEPEPQR